MNAEVIKHTREELREDQYAGRTRSRIVTTWDLVHDGVLISEHRTRKAAVAAGKEYNRNIILPDDRRPIVCVKYPNPRRS